MVITCFIYISYLWKCSYESFGVMCFFSTYLANESWSCSSQRRWLHTSVHPHLGLQLLKHQSFNEGSLGHRSAISHRRFPHMYLDGHAHTELIEQSHTPSASMLKGTEIGSLPTSISAESVGKDADTWNRMAVSDTMCFEVSEHRILASTRHIQNSTAGSLFSLSLFYNMKH